MSACIASVYIDKYSRVSAKSDEQVSGSRLFPTWAGPQGALQPDGGDEDSSAAVAGQHARVK